MPGLRSNGIHIEYEEYGEPDAPVLLLLQGLNIPCTGWPPILIEMLVDAGFRVITPDNRDIGLSENLDHLGTPNFVSQILRKSFFLPVNAPYALDDMANDMLGLLDGLGIETAHLVGVSMGGMISQIAAINAPQRIKSLTSIMSTTNRRGLPGPTKAVRNLILKGPADRSDEGIASFYWQLWRALGSPGYPLPDDELRGFLDRMFTRGMTASGTARQQAAIVAAPGRDKQLAALKMPVQVIHGDADPLIPLACGLATAAAVPHSNLRVIEGMGHDLPTALCDEISQLIISNARAAG